MAAVSRPHPDRVPESRAATATEVSPYAVVHLVVQEASKDLIGPQVADHMAVQVSTGGVARPAVVVIGLLEAARHALRSRMRRRARELAARAPGTRVLLLPYSSRLGTALSARYLATRLRRAVGNLPVVFHCRGENAVWWASAVAPRMQRSGIVADVRGAWPEELLFARGYDGPEQADPVSRRDYEQALSHLKRALDRADAVLSVSAGMVDWLRRLGVHESRLTYVPCCVKAATYCEATRTRMRRELGLDGRLVFVYLGTITRYQHLEDGAVPFFRAASAACAEAHLLCLTDDPARMRALLDSGGVDATRTTVIRTPQHAVADHLAAGDAGLLLRAPSRINRFSQPTKVAEYLASGLPLVVARGTGQVDSSVEAHGAGATVTWFGACEQVRGGEVQRVCDLVRRGGYEMRRRAVALCEREFLWSCYVDSVRAAYQRALAP